jgi:hypothetical protein
MDPIDALAYALEVAKDSVVEARLQLERAEGALLAAVPFELEGSTTTRSTHYKITTTGKLTRAVDAQQLEAVRSIVPSAIFDRVVRFKPDLSLRELRYVEQNEPELYRAFATAITTSPAKTSVKVARIIEE